MNDTFETEVRELLRELQKDYRKESVSGAEGFQGAAGHDVFPGGHATVLLAEKEEVVAKEMTWGFFSPKDKRLLINARAETALEKPMFSESILNRRCIIPASRFYEWGRDKNKVTFYRPKKDMLYFAGFYRMFQDGERFIILTTQANASMVRTHDRMPVILEKEDIPGWLTEDEKISLFLRKEMLELVSEQEYEQTRLF